MYTVKILSEKEFDGLPYKHAKTSLGLADAKTGVAYVRDTGYNDITKHTIDHELDELIAKTSPHEEDGIRYKNLASLAGGAGSGILSSMVPALKGFAPLISAGVGAAVNKDKNYLQGAAQGLAGGGIGTGLGGGIFDSFKGVTQPGGTFGKALQQLVPGMTRGVTEYAGALPGFGGIGTSSPTGKIAQWLQGTSKSPISLSTAKPLTGGAGTATEFAKSMATPQVGQGGGTTGGGTTGGGFSINDSIKKMIPSLGIAGLGELFAPKVETPDFSGIRKDLESKITSGGEPLAKEAGMKELLAGLDPNRNMTGFAQGDTYAKEQLVNNLRDFDTYWKSIRPGADYKNDAEYQYQRQEIIRKATNDRTEARDAQQLQQMATYMQTALNLDQSQMAQYVTLAQLDVNQLMLKYGVDVETATKFKQMFADLANAQYGGVGQNITLADLKNAIT